MTHDRHEWFLLRLKHGTETIVDTANLLNRRGLESAERSKIRRNEGSAYIHHTLDGKAHAHFNLASKLFLIAENYDPTIVEPADPEHAFDELAQELKSIYEYTVRRSTELKEEAKNALHQGNREKYFNLNGQAFAYGLAEPELMDALETFGITSSEL